MSVGLTGTFQSPQEDLRNGCLARVKAISLTSRKGDILEKHDLTPQCAEHLKWGRGADIICFIFILTLWITDM